MIAERSVDAHFRRDPADRATPRRALADPVRDDEVDASQDAWPPLARRASNSLDPGFEEFSFVGRPTESGPRVRVGARKAARIASFCARQTSTRRRNSPSSHSLDSNVVRSSRLKQSST
jgi:hypothetical protein